jgi:hypothetical protein
MVETDIWLDIRSLYLEMYHDARLGNYPADHRT